MLYVIAIIVGLLLSALLLWQIHHIVRVYRQSIGTPWQKFLAAFSDSATILWARLVAFFGAGMTFMSTLLPDIDPSSTVGQYVVALFTPETAKYWLAGIGVLGLIFEYVRRRHGSVDPILPPAIGTAEIKPT